MTGTDLLLHGFAGNGASWDPVIQAAADGRWRPKAPDLPGHRGEPLVPGERLPQLAARLASRYGPAGTLAGYSMGGRIALQMALDHPGCAGRLVLVSTGAGITDPKERQARAEADEQLAGRFAAIDRSAVADLWLSTALFADDPPQAQELARAQIEASDPAGLAGALRAFGPGEMEPLWPRLGELAIPVTIVAGERDRRYVEIGEAMAEAIPDSRLVVMPGAGHALLREAPEALAPLIAP